MEIELHETKLRVYEDGRIEKFGFQTGTSKKESWFQLKGNIHISKRGYKAHRTTINKKQYATSRIIFYAFHQDWNINDSSLNNTIDHINRDSLDNNIINLRVATMIEQAQNRHYVINQKGYHWDKSKNKWVSKIGINGKQFKLGCFKTEEEASLAYQNAVLKLSNS